MARPLRREIGLVVSWLLFPLVPVVLEDVYYQISNREFFTATSFGPDPREWGWFLWIVMLGPLLGYGFLAGATVDLVDDPDPRQRWWRRLLARRSVWVAVGPWWGSLVLIAGFFGLAFLAQFSRRREPAPPPPRPWNDPWKGTWVGSVAEWAFSALAWVIMAILTLAWSYSWLWPAWAASKRAARRGELRRAFYRGLSVALAFVGSLFGSFWAATSLWRSYFFDPRVVPMLLMAGGLGLTAGCAAPITYGEVRRRELFHAMLVAWVLGLALMWRWVSRRRRQG